MLLVEDLQCEHDFSTGICWKLSEPACLFVRHARAQGFTVPELNATIVELSSWSAFRASEVESLALRTWAPS